MADTDWASVFDAKSLFAAVVQGVATAGALALIGLAWTKFKNHGIRKAITDSLMKVGHHLSATSFALTVCNNTRYGFQIREVCLLMQSISASSPPSEQSGFLNLGLKYEGPSEHTGSSEGVVFTDTNPRGYVDMDPFTSGRWGIDRRGLAEFHKFFHEKKVIGGYFVVGYSDQWGRVIIEKIPFSECWVKETALLFEGVLKNAI